MNSINNTHGDAAGRTLLLLQILKEKTDMDHVISIHDLIAELAEQGYSANRQTIYRSLEALRKNGHDIQFTRRNGQGYYYVHAFTPAEVLILSQALSDAQAIDSDASENLSNKLMNQLSIHQQKHIPHMDPTTKKTENKNVLTNIELILQAIAKGNCCEFLYYDMTIDRKKAYRRSSQTYHLRPCSVLFFQGRYYGIFYSAKYQDFASYRLDKMDHLCITEDKESPVPFQLESWIRSSFQMYHGDPETITAVFDRSLSNILFDQFGYDMIISEITETHFTASIRTAVTPTLIAWLLQFPEQIKVLRPASLIQSLRHISTVLQDQYGMEGDHQNGRK